MGVAPDNAQEPELPAAVEGRKRVFPFDSRCAIVRYYDSLPKDGSKGAYLRRSGVFKSSVNQWRVDMVNGVSEPKRPGRKAVDPTVREMARMKAEISRLERELARANAVIDVQKKVSELLDLHLGDKEQAS
jgi:transposase